MTAFRYPPARRDAVADDYQGEVIPDPYRWLEDVESPETQAWISAQRAVTEAFLASVASRLQIQHRLAALWDYPRFDVPFERGGRWFQTRNSGLQNQPVLYVSAAPDDDGRPLLDPNLLSPDGTVAVTSLAVDEAGSLLAYATSDGGSDWRTWHLRDVNSGYDLTDVVAWSKFSEAAWRRDGSGFYYGAMTAPQAGRELAEENRCPQIRFHRVGTPQEDDQVVFFAPDQPDWLPDAAVSDDDRYLIISVQRGTNPENQVLVLEIEHAELGYRTLVGGFDAKAAVITNVGSTFVVLTDDTASRGRLVSIQLDKPDRGSWTEIRPEEPDTLVEAHCCGGKLVCHYLRDAHSVLRIHELSGRHLWDIPLPGVVSVAGSRPDDGGIEGRPGSEVLHFRVTSFTESGAVWSHNVSTGKTRLVRPSTARIDPDAYVTEQVFATSDDGTRVPLFLTRRRDLRPTGEVPVLLYGYGGFDIPVRPTFSVPATVWMERGGIFAVANLRGGGEYGREWHDAGRLAHKQNVFDDFCACARWLSDSGWTVAARTAIYGGSNGGLLVGACLTQRPELFGAAISDVGVFDMLRFHRFTIGWAWTSDFGSPDDPEQFVWLRAYSPLHNVRPGWCYPATMLFTGDHDDRVVPGHSLKFAATLQAAQGCERPVLLRVETAAGHGQGKPVSKLIAESTDRLAFLDAALGLATG
jgi:prolyl oligopeptidase